MNGSVRRSKPLNIWPPALPPNHHAFALVLTLSLLSLLVLTVLALSALTKISARITTVAVYQTQARQNALLGLQVGLRDLQRHAGADACVTGMAGITDIPAHSSNITRHWCGVWAQSNGEFIAWLTSGAQASSAASLQTGLVAVELVGDNTVGAAAANSEHVVAGKIPLRQNDAPGAPGSAPVVGSYAYLVLDEGVKVSAYAPPAQLSRPGVKPLLTGTAPTSAAGKLAAALATYSARLPAVLSYEQLRLLPSPAAGLTPSVLQDNFHHVTLTAMAVVDGQSVAGNININTNSTIVWRSVLETYNSIPGVTPIPPANLNAAGNALGHGLAATNQGKAPNRPFTQVEDVAAYLAVHFPLTGSPTSTQIMDAIRPLLSVRSDTFRLRAYGEALNPIDATHIEAIAYCEALVQRSPNLAPHGLGRIFTILSFRWLGPNDI